MFDGEGRLEELFDRMARRVAILDGHGLFGHRSSLVMAGGASTRLTAAAARPTAPTARIHPRQKGDWSQVNGVQRV